MPGKFAKAIKGFFVVALVTSATLAGLHYKEEAIQHWERLHVPQAPVAVEASPEAIADLIDSTLRRAQASGKIPIIKFSLQNCAASDRMTREVISMPEWTVFAKEKLEISYVPFPTNFSSDRPDLVRGMELLDSFAKASGAGQGFPFVAVLAKDGSLLGARSGYSGGGTRLYINWIEKLAASDKTSPKKLPPVSINRVTYSAHGVVSRTVDPVSIPVAPPTNSAPAVFEVVLKGVSGTDDRKVALIGVGKRNIPLMIGEKKKVPWEDTFKSVECREIGEREAVVQIEGEAEARHLALPLN